MQPQIKITKDDLARAVFERNEKEFPFDQGCRPSDEQIKMMYQDASKEADELLLIILNHG